MSVIRIDDVGDQVEELVSRAEAGETILIEKDGRSRASSVSPWPENPNPRNAGSTSHHSGNSRVHN
ncbi:MAG: hypothetical protein KDJ87_19485 [Rhizobiaceae bacterium]|nr:hypothetical protein [Rhizobiaceae bacterium]